MGVAHEVYKHIDTIGLDLVGNGFAAELAYIAQAITALGHRAGEAITAGGEHVADGAETAPIVLREKPVDESSHGMAAEIG